MSGSDLSILVIDASQVRAAIIEDGLREAGHARITVLHSVHGLVSRIAEIEPDVIVIDIEDPSRDQLEHLLRMSRVVGKPIAMFVDRSDAAMMSSAIEAGVSAYVVDGLRKDRVKAILDMAIARFNAYARLEAELADTRRALEDRKAIDRAKALLMRARGLSEDDAHRLLRRAAMNENRRMADVARGVVASASLLLGDTK